MLVVPLDHSITASQPPTLHIYEQLLNINKHTCVHSHYRMQLRKKCTKRRQLYIDPLDSPLHLNSSSRPNSGPISVNGKNSINLKGYWNLSFIVYRLCNPSSCWRMFIHTTVLLKSERPNWASSSETCWKSIKQMFPHSRGRVFCIKRLLKDSVSTSYFFF